MLTSLMTSEQEGMCSGTAPDPQQFPCAQKGVGAQDVIYGAQPSFREQLCHKFVYLLYRTGE